MGRYVVRRILQMIPVFIGTTILIFAMEWAVPGDPFAGRCGQRPCPPAFVAYETARHCLDDAPATQPIREHERQKPTGRKPPPEHLPRVDVEVLPDDVQRQGLDAFERIGQDISETVERRPASLVSRVLELAPMQWRQTLPRPEVLQRLDANIYRRASLAPVAASRAGTDAAR